MNNARNNIIERLKFVTPPENRHDATVPAATPQWSEKEMLRRFIDRLEAVRAEVIEVAQAELAAALVTKLQESNIETLLHDPGSEWAAVINDARESAETFPRLLAYDREIEKWKETLFYHVDAAITTTLGGIAETGSLILWPTATEPRSMSLVPPVHIAILKAGEIYATLADAMEKQQWAEHMPTNLILVSGPSKTADIERTLAYGVHGPKELIVLIVYESSVGELHRPPSRV